MVRRKEVHHIVDAALALAAERGWSELSLADVAARLKMPLSDLVEHFPGKTSILEAYSQYIDDQVLKGDLPEAGEPVRDRLFDILMRRFDAMAPHKAGIKAVLRDSGTDPVALLCGARQFHASMSLMLEAAGVSSSGLLGLFRIEAISAVYVYALRIWLKDDSPDMSSTMASLDKALRRAEDMASLLGKRRSAPSSGVQDAAQHPS